MRLSSPFAASAPATLPTPAKTTSPRLRDRTARSKPRRRGSLRKPAVNIIEQCRHLVAAETMKQPHRFDRGFGRVLAVTQSVGDEERRCRRSPSTLQESPHTSSPGIATETAPQPECDGARRGVRRARLDPRQHGGAEPGPRSDVDEMRLPDHGAETVAPRCRRSNSRPRDRLRHSPMPGPRSSASDFDAAAVAVLIRRRSAFRRRRHA